jgi:hypothetical protein
MIYKLYDLNRVTTINNTFNIERDLLHNTFTESEKLHSFYLFQEEVKKDKFFIGRLSGNETLFVSYIINNITTDSLITDSLIQNMLYGAGIQIKTNQDAMLYAELYNKSVLTTTLLGIWDSTMYQQNELFLQYLKDKNIKKMCAQGLDPVYYMDEPNYNLNNLLQNKKILIITSHKETTLLQLNKLDMLYNKPIFHNSNTFYIYKPAQQNAGSHDTNSWTHHYKLMTQDLLNIYKEFAYDLALVSAGGFGMLLCNFIYINTTASVVYVGGSLQLYFGIMGKRWQTNSAIIKNINNNWTYPLDVDKPKHIESCEGGCYW